MEQYVSKKKEILGSVVEIFLPSKSQELFEVCFDELLRIQNKFSRFDLNSELNKLNKNLNVWQNIDEEFLFLIKKSLKIQKNTNGYFEITLKSTLEDLGYDANYSFRKIKKSRFSQIKSKISSLILRPIILDEKKFRVYLRTQIEFGGIGKGYALDRLYDILNKNNVDNFLINAGGDVICKQNGDKNWVSLLQHPDDLNKVIGEINVNNKSLAGSAPSYRNWGESHHLINPKTKLAQNGVKSIFVLANTGIESDAYATALFVSGFENAIKFSNKLNLEILVISSSNQMYKSKNFNVNLYT